jgi:hypothetical protein
VSSCPYLLRRNSSNPNVPSGRLKMSTQRSSAAVEGLDKTDKLGPIAPTWADVTASTGAHFQRSETR